MEHGDDNSHWYCDSASGKLGPLTKSELLDAYNNGRLKVDTLVWNPSFEDSWKRLDEALNVQRLPPPLPLLHPSNTFAWILAITPVLVAACLRITDGVPSIVVYLAGILPFSYVIGRDLIATRRVNHLSRWTPLWTFPLLYVWEYVAPIYFVWRFRALRERRLGAALVLISLAATIGGYFIRYPGIPDGLYLGTRIPSCNSTTEIAEVQRLFNGIPLIKQENIRAISLSQETTKNTSSSQETCTGTVSTDTGKAYSVRYVVSLDNGYIDTYVTLP